MVAPGCSRAVVSSGAGVAGQAGMTGGFLGRNGDPVAPGAQHGLQQHVLADPVGVGGGDLRQECGAELARGAQAAGGFDAIQATCGDG